MANENDEVQQNNNNSNSSNGSVLDALPTQEHANDTRATQADSNADDTTSATADITEGLNNCARRGKLNDLVADLCINGNGADRANMPAGGSSSSGGFGDYTNIRATLGPASFAEPVGSQTTTVTQQPHAVTAPPTQNSSLSFKHFLNSSSSALPAPSTTITSLDPVSGTSGSVSNVAINSSSSSLQTSTGARPKVPQSASSTSSISSLMSGLSVAGGTQDTNNSFTSAATKMKRSPRFSSFDSQASLVEYAGVSERAESNLEQSTVGVGGVTSSGFRLYPDALGAGSGNESSDFFSSRTTTGGGSQYVPRSYSNYEMPIPTASPRRRMANSNAAKEARPTRLALNTNSSVKLKLDLPIDNAASNTTRPLPNNAGDYAPPPPGAAAAAALPDFVQDHWMDSWYAHEMHLNSPPISPIRDFVEDITGTALGASNAASGSVAGGAGSSSIAIGGGVGGVALGSAEAAASCGGPSVSNSSAGEPSGSSKMLPDFLSDGPIIHSSQRLADVAAGLPSNSIGSPDDPPMSSQLSRLRIDNERLQRELNDARLVLNEQIRRGNELERQLQERQRSEQTYSRAQNISLATSVSEEDKNKRRTAAPTQNHITKLKQQVTQLTAEVETLRRENETLREEGAVGGCSAPSCDRPYATAAAGAGVRGNSGRPSRTQQVSRDLLRAAANAESNLRQLLTGVENLRQMAADIESSELRLDYDVSPDLFSDFLDECDDYEEYPGGPAL